MLDHVCSNCDQPEERLFTDTWTGLELCIMCLAPIINNITMLPETDRDNLPRLLREDGRTYEEGYAGLADVFHHEDGSTR